MKIKPLFDRVLIKPENQEEQTASGLTLPISAEDKPYFGKVVAVGDNTDIEGKKTLFQVAVGDKIVYGKYGGLPILFEGKEYVILKQTDILAKIEGEN
ncbi:MAG: co-chaperone GroES [Clostridia bacterium]|nr:co-chaperone GroES [Clostridia bacterium]